MHHIHFHFIAILKSFTQGTNSGCFTIGPAKKYLQKLTVSMKIYNNKQRSSTKDSYMNLQISIKRHEINIWTVYFNLNLDLKALIEGASVLSTETCSA